jgi:hypothetical protein
MSASASFEAVKWKGRIALSSAAAPPDVAGEGLCAKESKAKPSVAMIMGSAFFMTAFLVELPLNR